MSLFLRQVCAWSIHLFTSLGAFFGLLALNALYHHQPVNTLWYLGAAFVVDNIDGTLARFFRVTEFAPQIDGALLDNIIDFFTYSLIPAVFIIATNLVAPNLKILSVALICFASCYQFTQRNAKTADHFFRGFPSYWNILVFYAFCWHLNQATTFWLIVVCFVGSFIPIKYLYLSRMEHLSNQRINIVLMLIASLVWFACAVAILTIYPQQNSFINYYSMGYIALYFLLSLYRTAKPLPTGS